MPRSTQVYGIDTSIFVRLLTGHPESDFEKTVRSLERICDQDLASELVVSNQVIGESYITLQHFYGISKSESRKAILDLLQSGAVRPLNGGAVLDILSMAGGAGLMDRLIAQDYNQRNADVLTNDKRMAKLDGAKLLN